MARHYFLVRLKTPLLRVAASLVWLLAGCRSASPDQVPLRYRSASLRIQQLAPHVYQHTSYLETNDFGRVACNGMLVVDGGEALVFNTPANAAASRELLAYAEHQLRARVKAVVPTHFHADCLAGLAEFHRRNVPSYALHATIALARSRQVTPPQQGFDEQLRLRAGQQEVIARFVGEGHTPDNIVAYVPAEQVLFGGCLIKELGAGKGNLEDANVAAWPQTVATLQQAYPATRVLIPGHGKTGGLELSNYTIQLFK